MQDLTRTAMTFAQAVFHFFGFILPAFAMAALMPLAGRWVMGRSAIPWPRRVLWHLLMGLVVLLAGLVLQGQDGQMSTYAALVGMAGTLEWVLQRGWRR